MDTKPKLENLARDVNDLLLEYIDIHNSLMEKSNTPLSVFRPIDFESFEKKTENLLVKMVEKTSEVRDFNEHPDLISPNQKEFHTNLYNYCEALVETLKSLLEMISGLLEKSMGSRGRKYSVAEYRKAFAKYKESRENYFKYGAELNRLYDKI